MLDSKPDVVRVKRGIPEVVRICQFPLPLVTHYYDNLLPWIGADGINVDALLQKIRLVVRPPHLSRRSAVLVAKHLLKIGFKFRGGWWKRLDVELWGTFHFIGRRRGL